MMIVPVVGAQNERHAVDKAGALGCLDLGGPDRLDHAIDRDASAKSRQIGEEQLRDWILLGRDLRAGAGSIPSRHANLSA